MLKNRRGFSQAANNKLDGRVCMKEASYLINVEFFTASRCFGKTTRRWHKWFIPQDVVFTYKKCLFF